MRPFDSISINSTQGSGNGLKLNCFFNLLRSLAPAFAGVTEEEVEVHWGTGGDEGKGRGSDGEVRGVADSNFRLDSMCVSPR